MIKRIISKFYKSSSEDMLRDRHRGLESSRGQSGDNGYEKELEEELRERFSVYQTSNLLCISAEGFAEHVQAQIGVVDAKSEGYLDWEVERQRGLSIKFHWGHNHDFGEFKLKGRMGDRHLNVLANFVTLFPVSLHDFNNKNILDIGCWTGGTTLLLATLGSKIVAIEEVKKYADMVSFLAKSFGIDDRVTVKSISIYECNSEEFHDRFDIIYFPGVIYHLSDPVLALRIAFNSLKLGGIILVESAGINREEPFCRFDGSLVYHAHTKESLSQSGWNWFIPSPSALCRMMREAGFDEVKTVWHDGTHRVYGYGRKVFQVGICKAGLSVRNIR